MNTTKPTISIAIPAYNEGDNISVLLEALVAQDMNHGEALEILVVSDGSTDATVARAKSVPDGRITIIDRKERRGLNRTQNEIVERARGDILVLLNADVVPQGEHFIEMLTAPFITDSRVGLTGADTIYAQPLGWLERIVAHGHDLRVRMYRTMHGGNTVYLCHGRARAFTRALYRQIHWPDECPEDSYSYFFAIQKGFTFAYIEQAKVIFRSPTTFEDYARQSRRFMRGKQLLAKYFPPEFIKEQFRIPFMTFIRIFISGALWNPMRSVAYWALFLVSHFSPKEPVVDDVLHDISLTTKKIIV